MSEIKIGLKFKNKNKKHNNLMEVVDIHKTYNSKGDLVRTEYVCENDFIGQKITSIVPASTIAMSEKI